MTSSGQRRGFSLVEAIVVLTVIAVLAAILVPCLSYARESAKLNVCVANLGQISVAAKMYYEDQNGPPLTDLPVALADYVDSNQVFICPTDKEGQDSYSEFFVARRDATGDQYVVGCPRHHHGKRAAIAFGKSDMESDRVAKVTWNGEAVGPGDTVTGGVLQFSDGSRVTIQDDLTVGMLCSFSTRGTTYSMVWVPEGCTGRIDCEVTPGSMFEVVTPAAIAGVQGTKFTVWVPPGSSYATQDQSVTVVQVRDGKVRLETRVGKARQRLAGGRSGLVADDEDDVPISPKPGKKGKRYGKSHGTGSQS